MKPYLFLLREEVLREFMRRNNAERELLLRRIHVLAAYPEQPAEKSYSGAHGEEIRCHRFGRWRLTYQVDSPVRQIYILNIEKLPV